MPTGKIKTKRNKAADGREAKTLHVLYVQDDAHRTGWALTEKELARVERRALSNPEDVPDSPVIGEVHRAKNQDAKPQAATSYYHVRVQSCESKTSDWLVTANERNTFIERAAKNSEDMPMHLSHGQICSVVAAVAKALG